MNVDVESVTALIVAYVVLIVAVGYSSHCMPSGEDPRP